MNTYSISFFYLATGMEGIASYIPTLVISEESEDAAIHEYHRRTGTFFKSFAEYMRQDEYVRRWGITCKKVVK